MVLLFVFAILSAKFSNNLLAVITGCFIYIQIVIAHNYFHRKNNFRMYGINLSGADWYSGRITHVLSHHIYTNSYYDVEVTFLEPFLQFLPRSKTMNHKFLAVVLSPIFWTISVPLLAFTKLMEKFSFNFSCEIYFFQTNWLFIRKNFSLGLFDFIHNTNNHVRFE